MRWPALDHGTILAQLDTLSGAFFDAFDDFFKIHIKPHPTNKTIITFEDGEQTIYDAG